MASQQQEILRRCVLRMTNMATSAAFDKWYDNAMTMMEQETILRLAHQFEPFLRRFGQCLAMQQDAEGLLAAPPYPAAKLVQLRQTEPLRLFDDRTHCSVL